MTNDEAINVRITAYQLAIQAGTTPESVWEFITKDQPSAETFHFPAAVDSASPN